MASTKPAPARPVLWGPTPESGTLPPGARPTDLFATYPVAMTEYMVPAGFPSPAGDYAEEPIDLAQVLVPNPVSTFVMKVVGDSMKDAGISSGDLLVVDRGADPTNGSVVVAAINGEFTCKRLVKRGTDWALEAANPEFSHIPLSGDMEMTVWGVVTYVVHKPS